MSRPVKKFICKTCGKEFKSKNYKKNKPALFCGKECRIPKISKICPECGKEFFGSKNSKEFQNKKFCSQKCSFINKRKDKIGVVCEICGKKFKKPSSQVKNKNFCSEKCKLKSYEKTWITKKCPVCGKIFKTRQSKEKINCSNYCSSQSKERKINLRKKYKGVSLLERGYSQEEYDKHIKRTINRNNEMKGKSFEELYPDEKKRKKLLDNLKETSSGDNNPMSYKKVMERNGINSFEEARKLMPAVGRIGKLHPMYGKHHTLESKMKIMKTTEINGKRKFFVAMGYFDDIYWQGSWELKYLIDCIKNNIPIKRYDLNLLEYVFEGNPHHYFPDFIINEDTIIEIKGLDKKNKKTIYKIKQCKEKYKEKYKVIYDVGQKLRAKTFYKLMEEKYKERLIVQFNPHKDKKW